MIGRQVRGILTATTEWPVLSPEMDLVYIVGATVTQSHPVPEALMPSHLEFLLSSTRQLVN